MLTVSLSVSACNPSCAGQSPVFCPSGLGAILDNKNSPAPRVTPADVEAVIASEHYFTAGHRDAFGVGLTFCVLTTKNGQAVTGEACCAGPVKRDPATGRVWARKNAIDKLWPMVVYAERKRLAAGGQPDTNLQSALNALRRELASDADTAWAWHCNIAMPIADSAGLSHEKANRAAATVMRHLFEVDIEKHPQFVAFESAWSSPLESTGPFGSPELLQQARDLLTAIERLPAGEHASQMSLRIGEVTFGLQQLQSVGYHFWPHVPT